MKEKPEPSKTISEAIARLIDRLDGDEFAICLIVMVVSLAVTITHFIKHG